MSSEAGVGALDEAAVREKVGKVREKAERCVERGREALPYLGGDVAVFVRVDGTGRATEAFFEESTLGHADTERCILEAFRSQRWPRPVGGDMGEIAQQLGFQAGYADPPAVWSGSELAGAMGDDAGYQELIDKLDGCRDEAGAGSLLVTMYLDEDGLVQGVGVSGKGEASREAASCVSAMVQTTSFPATGELVKATVEVP